MARAHIPPTPHRESPARSAFHPQNSTPHTRTLPRCPIILRNSAASASPHPQPSHAPQNSHTQTPPAALSAPLLASKLWRSPLRALSSSVTCLLSFGLSSDPSSPK